VTLKRGKLPARPGAISLKFGDFIKPENLPPLPDIFGHSLAVPSNQWGMLGNDRVGDCVLAGAAHETMIWRSEANQILPKFSANGIERQYFHLTGGGDHGLDVQQTAKWRRDVGLTDDEGGVHQIAAYLALDPGNINHLFYGVYLFGAVGLGLRLPDVADMQFRDNQPWDFTGATASGGHYVPFAGRRPGMLHVITWGQRWPMLESSLTPNWIDEAVVYISKDSLANEKSPEGFDYAALNGFLSELA